MFISVDSTIMGELFEILFPLLMQDNIHRAALYNRNHALRIILNVFLFVLLHLHFISCSLQNTFSSNQTAHRGIVS